MNWAPLHLHAMPVERVWGGQRLAETTKPIGELWAIGEENVVRGGSFEGRTVAQLAAEFPTELLGRAAQGDRFPLLIKLLDCADWLSLQVHPNDDQAAHLEGVGKLGKTEAWYILDAAPGARLIAGVAPHTSPEDLRYDILSGQVMNRAVYREVSPGDSLMIPAGTIHALGPGILLYEVQQSSDITYRIYDWDRPASAGRVLHLSQSAEVSQAVTAELQHLSPVDGVQELLRCDYFVLERLTPGRTPLERDTAAHTFHALTVLRGEATLHVDGVAWTLNPYESVLVPAGLGRYALSGDFEVLSSRLP
ncbi:MAG: class I mannose-6-phosphate isomerase [Deinococcus sp.]|uniref:type I phosphomannose isomerase catalytic subunit n=1 Tax=Deinococcus sp. TaxID=47478 RepID=UPI0026DB08C7|nr:type I phosphomannose isomerase catalytic subunit [Deinococcus sp.]MDO4244601.1 class I mannose-6-phosphate isomerase [Deinococcus sp.]